MRAAIILLLSLPLALGSCQSPPEQTPEAIVQVSLARHADADVRVMTYNIKNSFGNFPTTEKNCGQWCCGCTTHSLVDIADNIIAEDPDIVALQEIGVRLRDAEYEDQLRTLSERTGLPYYYQLNTKDFEHQDNVDIWLDSHGPSGTNGVAILSRFPFVGHPESLRLERDPQTIDILLDEDPTWNGRGNLEPMALRVTVDIPTASGTVRTDIYSVHLDNEDDTRREQAHLIDGWARRTRPAILLGDLNTHDFHNDQSQLDTMVGWTNPWPSVLPSYPSNKVNKEKQIDFALVRNVATGVAHQAFWSGGTESDHLPIVYDLELVACDRFDLQSPDINFCDQGSMCAPCKEGQGGCASDQECEEGLLCQASAGGAWGLPGNYGVCEIDSGGSAIPGTIVLANPGTAGPASIYSESQEIHVSVASDDTFDMTLSYATDQDRQVRVLLDGRSFSRAVLLRPTGGYGAGGVWDEVVIQGLPMRAGDHVVRVEFTGDGVNVDDASFAPSPQGPWQGVPRRVAEGLIEAEHFDHGGHVDHTPGNDGPTMRTDAPDIYRQDSRAKVRMQAGESVLYSLDSPVERTLDLHIRYTAAQASTIHIELDGVDATGPIAMPATNGSGSLEWDDVVVQDLLLPINTASGTLPMRVVVDAGQVGVDFYRFFPRWDSGPIAGEPWTVPSTIEAEYYDFGGYWDSTPGNDGDVYRYDDDVELWDDRTGHEASGGFLVWGTSAGEYLEYTFFPDPDEDSLAHGANTTMSVTLTYATTFANETVSILIDGVPVASGVALSATGGWGQPSGGSSTWDTHTISGLSTTNDAHVLRIVFDTGRVNLDKLELL